MFNRLSSSPSSFCCSTSNCDIFCCWACSAAEREENKSPHDAIFQACLLRFRPIMMTTMAALLGGLPLALGTGTGSELRRPLGITIVGGLIVSQVLTLFTTPVVYLFFDRLGRKSRHVDVESHAHAMSAD